jgi:hypothetical protein
MLRYRCAQAPSFKLYVPWCLERVRDVGTLVLLTQEASGGTLYINHQSDKILITCQAKPKQLNQ